MYDVGGQAVHISADGDCRRISSCRGRHSGLPQIKQCICLIMVHQTIYMFNDVVVVPFMYLFNNAAPQYVFA